MHFIPESNKKTKRLTPEIQMKHLLLHSKLQKLQVTVIGFQYEEIRT